MSLQWTCWNIITQFLFLLTNNLESQILRFSSRSIRRQPRKGKGHRRCWHREALDSGPEFYTVLSSFNSPNIISIISYSLTSVFYVPGTNFFKKILPTTSSQARMSTSWLAPAFSHNFSLFPLKVFPILWRRLLSHLLLEAFFAYSWAHC